MKSRHSRRRVPKSRSHRALAWGLHGGLEDTYPQMAYALVELLGEDGIAVMEQETRGVIGWDRLTQLLQRPPCRGMCGHVGMQNPASRVFHDHKDVEEPKRHRDHDAEVTGDDRLGMVADKGPPALRRDAVMPPRSRRLGRYFRTVRGDTRRPSLSRSSLAIRSCPQVGFS